MLTWERAGAGEFSAIRDLCRRLCARCGFRFAAAKTMCYEDTGWTEYEMYEYLL